MPWSPFFFVAVSPTSLPWFGHALVILPHCCGLSDISLVVLICSGRPFLILVVSSASLSRLVTLSHSTGLFCISLTMSPCLGHRFPFQRSLWHRYRGFVMVLSSFLILAVSLASLAWCRHALSPFLILAVAPAYISWIFISLIVSLGPSHPSLL